jgi:hypothetical protein
VAFFYYATNNTNRYNINTVSKYRCFRLVLLKLMDWIVKSHIERLRNEIIFHKDCLRLSRSNKQMTSDWKRRQKDLHELAIKDIENEIETLSKEYK